MNVEKKVKAFIEKEELIRQGDNILLGLSGGADSVGLFYLLLGLRTELGFALRAVHVHHGIRAEADKDAAYVESLCEREGIFCYIFREDVPAYADRQGLGEEEAGRIMRYRDFEKCLKLWEAEQEETEAEAVRAEKRNPEGAAAQQHGPYPKQPQTYKIATAHHENDQAETVLFQLFRGCGLSGLRGILPQRERIIRPLLCLTKEEIEDYLRERGITWCEDQTNRNSDYSRNRIRHQILPCAEREINRDVSVHIAKTAQIVREAEHYIRGQVREAWRKVAVEREDAIVFDIAALEREDIFLQKQLFLYGFERIRAARKDVGSVHVEDVLGLMRKQGNGVLSLPDGMRVQKMYGKLAFFSGNAEKGECLLSEVLLKDRGFLYGEGKPHIRTERIDLTEEETIKRRFGFREISQIVKCIPEKTYTKWFDYDKIKMPLFVRHWEKGDFFMINGEMNRKSFRRYMIENKIPPPQRSRIWLLADGSHVMWVPGGRMSAYYKVTKETKTILQIQICVEE